MHRHWQIKHLWQRYAVWRGVCREKFSMSAAGHEKLSPMATAAAYGFRSQVHVTFTEVTKTADQEVVVDPAAAPVVAAPTEGSSSKSGQDDTDAKVVSTTRVGSNSRDAESQSEASTATGTMASRSE